MKRLMVTLAALMVVLGSYGLAAMGDGPPPPECFTGSGSNPVLTDLYHSPHGLLLVFEQRVNSMNAMLWGSNAGPEYWSDRERIGDSKYSVLPHRNDPCSYGCGFGGIPPIVAVRLFRRIEAIGAIVYKIELGEHALDTLRLCDLYDSAVETECGTIYGLVLEFERGVDSLRCELMARAVAVDGPAVKIEYWTDRADIGDSGEATVLLPATQPDECETWVRELSNDPPIVGVRLFGDVVEISDMVYTD